MNKKRVTGWVAFLGVAATLAWYPELFIKQDDGQSPDGAPKVAAKARNHGGMAATGAGQASGEVKDLSPSGDLFAAQSWTPAPVVVSLSAEDVARLAAAAAAQPVGAPAMPFQFIGRLNDQSDLQVFLQNGEKIYVVRKGDVIDKTWRIEGISDVELRLVYLPLHLSQTLSVGSAQ
ncbi:hypothetical protein [Pseudomonas sp. NA-150]|uniref:hypothetical protein n=1 Tax=Pseudomonas sp. NA-150 TaxID=3367525 RepID=UPI0037C77911